jgi:hypothetical protein
MLSSVILGLDPRIHHTLFLLDSRFCGNDKEAISESQNRIWSLEPKI